MKYICNGIHRDLVLPVIVFPVFEVRRYMYLADKMRFWSDNPLICHGFSLKHKNVISMLNETVFVIRDI